ncbi:Methyltransferase domain-containing protein [Bacillus sp. OV322]|uniref:class I SAM-dependent methyltransferase n=1 Tax=Bacillus sp. OV322 TaxID=1882764 RepID=UPI0008E2613C|nr:class I SAM-dependent methyltransferase [Bacillus sp. OV322]SFC27547.1 Methyltransferase domain-containing protein [Bacillus sp. OV322]
MKGIEILEHNKKCWDDVAPEFYGKEALPEFGPYTVTEEEIGLFDSIENKRVLDIGCGSGHSLRYMADHQARELWGLDLSSSQIKTAQAVLQDTDARLFCAAMEDSIGLPNEYFDIIYSIYALGWTTDLAKTLSAIYSYLKEGGSFIFSWEHPFYTNLLAEDGIVKLQGSYQEEGVYSYSSFKGGNLPVYLYKRKLSTYINELVKAGFTIERLVEGEAAAKYRNQQEDFSKRHYSLYKARMVPTTFIIKARKLRK